VLLEDGTALGYDRLLLATGARPRPLPGTDPASARIRTLRSHADAMAIRAHLGAGRHIAIVGGGFIGLELAAAARTAGSAVTLIETQPRILTRGVPAAIAERVARRHAAEGVILRCGVRIEGITEDDASVRVALEGGDTVTADLLVVGIGAIPNTELAAAAGLAIDNGIAVNEELMTSAEGIYAAGDCCSFPLALYGDRRVRLEAWRNVQDQAGLVARNLLGGHERHSAVPWFWSDQYDLTLQVAGLADGAATTVTRPLGKDAFIEFALDGDGRLLAASGIGPGNAIARDVRLAEMMIAAGAHPDTAMLADPETKLKSLLAR
jgi:3-phenylpropionate/trans-cinnamate dioxygenase ferredoxin reductase subunit